MFLESGKLPDLKDKMCEVMNQTETKKMLYQNTLVRNHVHQNKRSVAFYNVYLQ